MRAKKYIIVNSIVLVVCLILSAPIVIWHFWVYPKNYEYALKLADDASLPEVKAGYLGEYLECISVIEHNPAYIFMRKDMELNRQKQILKGLIKRFKDIAKISPSEMAYQQGMEQLTGQEIDHQLDRISKLFKSAKLREDRIFLLSVLCGIAWLLFVIVALWWAIASFNFYN
jgi:hypothetical protein